MEFKNPQNGYIVEINHPKLYTLLFGCFYFAKHKAWNQFIISLGLGIITLGLSWLIYPFWGDKIIKKAYLEKGWIEVDAPPIFSTDDSLNFYKQHPVMSGIIGTIVVLIIIGIFSMHSKSRQSDPILTADSANDPLPQNGEPVKYRIDSWILYREYAANEVAADQKYKGKIIEVSGRIEHIGKDIIDSIYITLDGDSVIGQVQCMFSDDYTDKIASLNQGGFITIKGRCDGKLGNVILRDCSFMRN